MPAITPLAAGQALYQITDTRAFVLDLSMTAGGFQPHYLAVTRSATAGGFQLLLEGQSGWTEDLSAAAGEFTSPQDQEFVWETVAAGPDPADPLVVRIDVRDVSGLGVIDEPYVLRGRVADPVDWMIEVDSAAFDVTRLLCDPVAAFSAAPPPSIVEHGTVIVVAATATVGTVVGPPPTVVHRFTSTGDLAVPLVGGGMLPICGASPVANLRAPLVYDATSLDLRVEVAFDEPGAPVADACAGAPDAWLRGLSAPATMEVTPRDHRAVVVVDRSGSMALQQRWDNATTAARMLLGLFHAFRGDLATDDRIGVVVFDAANCVWGPAADTTTATALPLQAPADAAEIACALELGGPGGCTPLGDGLIAGMQLLSGGGDNTRYTLMVLTDGYENAGRVQVGPGALPAGVTRFSSARNAGGLADVNARMSLFTVGLGTSVDEPVLDNLPTSAPGGGQYLLMTDPAELTDAFGHMMSFSQQAAVLTTHATPGATAVTMTTATGAERLAVAVRTPAGTVALSFREAGTRDAFLEHRTQKACDSVQVVAVTDVRALGIDGAIEWRVEHYDIPDMPLALSPSQVLAYEDLRVQATVSLDQPTYAVGDHMRVTVHLRDRGQPIREAKVVAALEAPGVGLGEALTEFGHRYRPPDDVDDRDAPAGKALMISAMLKAFDWEQMPRTRPAAIFVDGSDDLHDPDGNGDYTNLFTDVDHEGSYTWTLRTVGVDNAGNPFDRLLRVSSWAGIRVDADLTELRIREIDHGSGLTAVEVTALPVDGRGRPLGPWWDHAVVFAVRDAEFAHVHDERPAPVAFDGTYRRVVLFRRDARPGLLLSIAGTRIGPFALHRRDRRWSLRREVRRGWPDRTRPPSR